MTPCVQPRGVGGEGDTGCSLLLPGETSSDAASCAQPCPCGTESWECLWVLLGPSRVGVGVTLFLCCDPPCSMTPAKRKAVTLPWKEMGAGAGGPWPLGNPEEGKRGDQGFGGLRVRAGMRC